MNGIIIVNKPQGYTSRDVVNKLTKIFKTKKIGHTGTLDPIATGVLVVCIGQCTKLCDLLTSTYKEYIATIKLGFKTDTLDITGTTIETKNIPQLNKETIIAVLNSFLGSSIQTTPIYSAVKVNGKKLYEYARQGQNVELPKREINIKEIKLLSFNKDEITFKTTVSKGTYIRALIDDICQKLNTVGTMSSLTRTKQGSFTIEDSSSLEEIEKNNYKLLSIEEVLTDLEKINIDDNLYQKIKNGSIIDKTFSSNIACLAYKNKIIAIYQTYDKDCQKAKPLKMFIN
ncbi:MAG TPA: tRNA pseudouridine(55) synthase TruB [Candidatus Coprovivens excrementavium]|nr:tRNA pseudouridine(55) synthase TruB [Candidatus Coprovivens excrementavium]